MSVKRFFKHNLKEKHERYLDKSCDSLCEDLLSHVNFWKGNKGCCGSRNSNYGEFYGVFLTSRYYKKIQASDQSQLNSYDVKLLQENMCYETSVWSKTNWIVMMSNYFRFSPSPRLWTASSPMWSSYASEGQDQTLSLDAGMLLFSLLFVLLMFISFHSFEISLWSVWWTLPRLCL